MLKRHKDNAKGFTLPEMLVVLAVMAAISLAAVPAFMSWLPDMRLNSSARQVYVALARARQGAVSQNSDACVKFSQSNRTVEVWLDNGPGAASGNSAKDASEPYVFESTLETDISIFFFPGDTFVFNARGMPKVSGWFGEQFLAYYLSLQNNENKYKIITVTPTGGVKVS